MKKSFLHILISFITILSASSQNTTNSPVSMFGIGELTSGEGGQYAGMGGTGIALSDANFINIMNPASLTGLQANRFTFDVGVMGAYKSYNQSGIKNHSVVGNLNNAAIGCRLTPWWYGAVSLTPVSSMSYGITMEQQVEGTDGSTVNSYFEGEGGVSRVSLSTAFIPVKNLSVGTNLSFITGSTTQSEQQNSITKKEVSDKRAFYADFGLQYKYRLAKNKELIFGAIYGYSQKLSLDNTLTVSSSSTDSYIDQSQHTTPQYLPQFWGAGVGYYTNRWILNMDYKFVEWSKMKSSDSSITFQNQNKVSFGLAFKPGDIHTGRTQLQLGGGINNSYVTVKNQKKREYYLSAGTRIVLNNAALSIGAKYTNQFNVPSNMPKDTSISLYLNISFSELSYRAKLK